MKVTPTELPDVMLLHPPVYPDSRGFFLETFNRREFEQATGSSADFVQDNLSRSTFGVLRGLHYQIQRAQGKLVQVVRGAAYDVAVDLRRSSRTFGHWVGVMLTEEEHAQLWIPAGFAHGFQVTSEYADVLYKTTDYYAPEFERRLAWNDPQLAIPWPVLEPTVSGKDAQAPAFAMVETYA